MVAALPDYARRHGLTLASTSYRLAPAVSARESALDVAAAGQHFEVIAGRDGIRAALMMPAFATVTPVPDRYQFAPLFTLVLPVGRSGPPPGAVR